MKDLRLRQNILRQDLSLSSGVSISTIARMEDGEIKSFESLLRIVRTLGMTDVFRPLVEEEEITPSEYYRMTHSKKEKKRRRATRSSHDMAREESEW